MLSGVFLAVALAQPEGIAFHFALAPSLLWLALVIGLLKGSPAARIMLIVYGAIVLLLFAAVSARYLFGPIILSSILAFQIAVLLLPPLRQARVE